MYFGQFIYHVDLYVIHCDFLSMHAVTGGQNERSIA